MLAVTFSYPQSESLDADRGQSYDSESVSNESIKIPLYTASIDGASVPIILSYNTSGFKVSDVPSNVGFGWSLHAGGGIEKETRHLIDESPNGWFFNENFDDIEVGHFTEPTGSWSGSNYFGSKVELYDTVDSSPDMFLMRMSNGFNLDYMYNRSNGVSNDDVVIFNQNNNAHIFTNFYRLARYSYNEDYEDHYYENDSEYDVMIHDGTGVKYSFRKGAKRERSWDLENRPRTKVDSTYFDNYYIHKISTTFNNQTISFEYEETNLKKLISHAKATRSQSNSDPMNPPHPQDPIVTDKYRSDISVQDVKRKDIKRIVTNKEIVEFIYKMEYYDNYLGNIQSPSSQQLLNQLQHQKIRLLDEIKVFDHNRNYILGYKFNYTEQTQEQSEHEGDLKIKSIIKYGKNTKNYFVYRKFDYGYSSRPPANTVAQDVFGYYNGKHSNDLGNLTPLTLYNQGYSDKLPSESHLISGMLKSITNRNGGKTEFSYRENSYGDMYYGGLLIDAINTRDANDNLINRIEYEYDEPEGYGLPIYNIEIDQTNGPPNAYEDGYYETQQQIYGWQTYFTKRDRFDNEFLTYYNVSNAPYELMANTPFLDYYATQLAQEAQEVEYLGLSQLSHGIIYKKITEKKINVLNNQEEKGKVVKYYEPVIKGYKLFNKINRIEIFNNNDIKIKETIYNYDKKYLSQIFAYNIDNSFHTDNFRHYYIDLLFVFNIKDVLKDVNELNFDYITGNFLNEYKTSYTYLNEDNPSLSSNYNKIKSSISHFNGEEFKKEESIYMSEHGFFDGQFEPNWQNLHYINPIVENNIWNRKNNQWLLESSIARSYLFNGSINTIATVKINPNNGQFYNETNFIHANYDQDGNLITQAEDVIEFEYLDNGRLKAQKDIRNGITTIYQRSNEYDGLYVDATLTTNQPYQSESNYFAKKSFENADNVNHIMFSKAFSGKYVYNGNTINLGNYPSDYVISFWSYENNKWVYNKINHSGGDAVITRPNGALYIDEVVIKPKYGGLSSFTIKPLIGKTSSLNSRGEGSRIEYNLFGEPLLTYDKKGNVLTEKRANRVNDNINN